MSSAMFLDLETLGIESTSVILSASFVYVEPDLLPEDNNEAYEYLLQQSCFVKFSVEDQLANYKRTMTKSTLDWWNKQGEIPKKTSFEKSKSDMLADAGMDTLRKFYNHKVGKNEVPVWVRGSLDQPCFESLIRAIDDNQIVKYNCYRDVRTALDLIYENSKNGYVEVPDFDPTIVMKHDPTHDCAYDGLMLFRGKQ